MPTIIFTISNAPGTVHKFKSLKKNGYRVVGCDANPDAVGRFFADAFYVVPLQNRPEYRDALLDIVKKEKADLLVAGEGESPILIEICDAFSALGCKLIATDLNTLQFALDKVKLFTFLSEEINIPLPEFFPVESLQDFDIGMKRIKNPKKCIKPAIASGSRGFVILNDKMIKADDFFRKKPGFSELTIDSFRSMLKASERIPKLILMEYLEDTNYDTTMICRDGEILFQSIRTREEAKLGTIIKGQIVEDDEIYGINKTIAEILNTTGYISTQFIGNKLIEINPRWSTTLTYQSINEYIFGIKIFTGEEMNINPDDIKNYPGIKMLRYWDVLTYKDGEGLVE